MRPNALGKPGLEQDGTRIVLKVHLKITELVPGMVANTCNPSVQEARVGACSLLPTKKKLELLAL